MFFTFTCFPACPIPKTALNIPCKNVEVKKKITKIVYIAVQKITSVLYPIENQMSRKIEPKRNLDAYYPDKGNIAKSCKQSLTFHGSMTTESCQIIPDFILDIPCRCSRTNIMADEDAEREHLTVRCHGVTREGRNTAQRPCFRT